MSGDFPDGPDPPWYRLHAPAGYDGPGIGPAVVNRIVNRHGGPARAESASREGSTSFVALPAA